MNNKRTIPFLLIIFLGITSCINNVDFTQVEDFSLTPIFKTPLVNFTVNQTDFFDLVNSLEITAPVDDVSSFTLLRNKFVNENLIQVELEFEMNNQFDRNFQVKFRFLDDNDKVTHEFSTFNIFAKDATFKQKERIGVSANQLFLSSTKVKVSIVLSPSTDGSVIDPNNPQTLTFKSAGTYYLKTN